MLDSEVDFGNGRSRACCQDTAVFWLTRKYNIMFGKITDQGSRPPTKDIILYLMISQIEDRQTKYYQLQFLGQGLDECHRSRVVV